MTTQEEKILQLKQALENFDSNSSELFDHKLEEDKAEVRRRGLLLLDQRARSRSELRQRLIALEFEDALVDMVLDDFEASKLLDDETFAFEWVRQRHQRRGKSRTVLDRELKDKGIAQSIRSSALEQITAESEEDIARGLAEKKARTIKAKPVGRADYDKALRRVVGVLARRGFNQSMSLHIAKKALDDRINTL